MENKNHLLVQSHGRTGYVGMKKVTDLAYSQDVRDATYTLLSIEQETATGCDARLIIRTMTVYFDDEGSSNFYHDNPAVKMDREAIEFLERIVGEAKCK